MSCRQCFHWSCAVSTDAMSAQCDGRCDGRHCASVQPHCTALECSHHVSTPQKHGKWPLRHSLDHIGINARARRWERRKVCIHGHMRRTRTSAATSVANKRQCTRAPGQLSNGVEALRDLSCKPLLGCPRARIRVPSRTRPRYKQLALSPTIHQSTMVG